MGVSGGWGADCLGVGDGQWAVTAVAERRVRNFMLARRARGRSGGDESEGLRVEVRGEFSRGGRFFISVSACPPSTAVGDGWSGPLEMMMRTDG